MSCFGTCRECCVDSMWESVFGPEPCEPEPEVENTGPSLEQRLAAFARLTASLPGDSIPVAHSVRRGFSRIGNAVRNFDRRGVR